MLASALRQAASGAKRSFVTSAGLVLLAACSGTTNPAVPRSLPGPLVVDQTSHVVVMEYEAWFGPNAVTFAGAAARPLLHSADMRSVGGGYDRADPAIIKQHVAWLEQMGIDAVTLDLTNDVSCIFDSLTFVRKYLEHFQGCAQFRRDYQTIRDNSGNLYPAWAKLGRNSRSSRYSVAST